MDSDDDIGEDDDKYDGNQGQGKKGRERRRIQKTMILPSNEEVCHLTNAYSVAASASPLGTRP
jgi:hypothetical protein